VSAATPAAWPLILEWLDEHGRVRGHVRLQGPRAVIGRAYTCDAVVDDPHVAAQHAALFIDAGGQLMVQDQGTINGVMLTTPARNSNAQTAQPLALGETLQLGLTHCRVVSLQHAVTPEQALPQGGKPTRTASQASPGARWPAPLLVALVATALGLSAFESWFEQVEKFLPVATLSKVLTLAGALMLWSGAWSLLTRVLRGRSRLLRHVAWASTFVLAEAALGWVLETVAFAMDWPRLPAWLPWLHVALLVVLVLGHVRLAFDTVSLRARASVVAMALGGLAVLGFSSWQSSRQWLAHDFMAVHRPAAWRVTAPTNLDAHFERVRAQRVAVDALRKVDAFDSETDADE
jgi:pSer/pThr/pTyr-binding forkhead associated (FHA) protein